MENWILVIGYDRNIFGPAQREWLKYNVLLHMVDTISEAIVHLSSREYLAVAVSAETPDLSPPLQIIRRLKPVPIVILSPEERALSGTEFLFSGADEFVDPSHIEEGVAKGREVIEHYHKLPLRDGAPVKVLSYKDLFMVEDFYKVFVNGKEIHLSKNETVAFGLLLSQAHRVFTYEQIYCHVYGEDAPLENMVNAIQCQIKRIRQKLRAEPGAHDCIRSVRGVGYRFAVS
jgi:DNA-binding response OmpR family regulator